MASSPLQALFLGTGTSTALPVGPCLAQADKPSRDVGLFLDDYRAAPEGDARRPSKWGGYDPSAAWPSSVPCGSCRAAVDPRVKDGWKNRRGNPAIVLRKRNAEGEWRNVVVDVGKTFREQSCRLFPGWGIHRIDAVVITHGHADAYNGLDDLREWCGRQGRAIPVYLSKTSFETVAASFPYLVDKTKASGGGDLPTLDFRIIEEECDFEVEGINIATVPVHHGRYFHAPIPAPSAPGSPNATPEAEAQPEPFICLGFVFDHSLVYLSDVSGVPEKSWEHIERALKVGREHGRTAAPVLVVDTLWPWRDHVSHVSFPQAMEIALRLKPSDTYTVGMTHPTTHFIWSELGRSVSGKHGSEPEHDDHALAQALITKVWESERMVPIAAQLREWAGRVAPAWDGLAIQVDNEGCVELPIGQGSTGGWGFGPSANL